MKLFALAASLREDSHNARLLELAVAHAKGAGATVEIVPFGRLVTPAYDEGARAGGYPEGAEELRRLLEGSDGFLLASPEYNYSFPGSLKNTIDWVSRYRPVPFAGRHALLLSASTSLVGGNRGLWQLRVPLEALGTHVHPDMFSLAKAQEAFDGGVLRDEALGRRLEGLVRGFVELVGRVRG